MSFNHGMIISHLLPIFYDRGLDAKTAVLAASCIGPMQVIGRLMMLASEKKVSVLSLCCVSFISMFFAGLARVTQEHCLARICFVATEKIGRKERDKRERRLTAAH